MVWSSVGEQALLSGIVSRPHPPPFSRRYHGTIARKKNAHPDYPNSPYNSLIVSWDPITDPHGETETFPEEALSPWDLEPLTSTPLTEGTRPQAEAGASTEEAGASTEGSEGTQASPAEPVRVTRLKLARQPAANEVVDPGLAEHDREELLVALDTVMALPAADLFLELPSLEEYASYYQEVGCVIVIVIVCVIVCDSV